MKSLVGDRPSWHKEPIHFLNKMLSIRKVRLLITSRYIAMQSYECVIISKMLLIYFISYGCNGGALVFLGGAEASASPSFALPMFITIKNQVRNLGVILETDLSFSSHVKAVTKSAYYHLKNIARIRCFVSSQDLEKLVHAFITSRVDYCNGLLTGLPKKTIRQLQLIQNAAARILTRTRKYEHITPVLRSLHWLPVTFRIDFKVLLLVYKSLNGIGPKYMADMLTEYKPNRPLRSLGSSQLEIPRVHTKQGESAFSYYAARSWNQLPEEIRCAKTLATFKSRLKTHLFSCAFVE